MKAQAPRPIWLPAARLMVLTALFTGCNGEPSADSPPSGPTLDSATAVSKSLAEFFEAQGKPLDELLAQMEKDRGQTPELAAKLAATRAKLPDHAVVAVFDAKRQLVAGDVLPEGLPPYKVVMPLLRRTGLSKKPTVSDMWVGPDKHFWVAQARIRGQAEAALTAVTAYKVAGGAMATFLATIQKLPTQNVQIMDDKGLAVWSTLPADRFKSAVHGTYLLDRVQGGQPFQTKCHNCHENAKHQIERSEVHITVVPVPGTKWSVSVR